MADVYRHKHQKVSEVAIATEEIVHIKDEQLSYPSGTKETKRDSPVIAVNYKPTPGRVKEMAEHKTVNEKNQGTLKSD